MYVCSMDVGTTGCKVFIFDEEGTPCAGTFEEYAVLHPADGWTEQDPMPIFRIALALLGKALKQSGIRELSAITLSVQGDAVIPVGRDDKPLYRAILGMDTRSRQEADWCDTVLGAYELFAVSGMRPHPVNSLTKIMWIERNRPDIAEKVHKYMTYESLFYKLLGSDEAITDSTMASRTMAYSQQSGGWCGDILRRTGVAAEKLCTIVPSGNVVGRLSGALAEELGLTGRPLLVAGAHDQVSAALGAGAVEEGLAVDSHGTAEVLSVCLEQPNRSRPFFEGYYPCYRHALSGKYFSFALNHAGGIVLKWLRDTLVWKDGPGGESISFGKLVEDMPEQPSGLLFLPHLNGSGTPYCDLNARGAIVGLTLASTKEEIVRALLEGLAFEMRVNQDRFAEIDIPIRAIRCVGGGAKSPKGLQLKADILGQPVSSLRVREAASLGAAIIGFTACGVFRSMEEGARALVRTDATYEPNPALAARYLALYDSYRNLYAQLRPIYRCE